MPEKQFYSPKEAAMIFGCNERLIYKWLKARLLKGFQSGGKGHSWIIPKTEIDRLNQPAFK